MSSFCGCWCVRTWTLFFNQRLLEWGLACHIWLWWTSSINHTICRCERCLNIHNCSLLNGDDSRLKKVYLPNLNWAFARRTLMITCLGCLLMSGWSYQLTLSTVEHVVGMTRSWVAGYPRNASNFRRVFGRERGWGSEGEHLKLVLIA